MTNPDALAGVVARVEHQLSLIPIGSGEYFLRADDLRSLLAALAEARSERDQLREAIDYVVDCDDSKWVQYFKDELAEIDRARTPQPETPE